MSTENDFEVFDASDDHLCGDAFVDGAPDMLVQAARAVNAADGDCMWDLPGAVINDEDAVMGVDDE